MWQHGINLWEGWMKIIYGKAKEEKLVKKTQGVGSQVWHMHRTVQQQVCHIDKHQLHISAEQKIPKSLDRKQQWVDCDTLAYEAWAALCASQIPGQRQVESLWNQAIVRCP